MFEPEKSFSFPKQEEAILNFWQTRQIYDKSLERRAGAPDYVFFEGPPTANGLPHPGHCLTRAIKDLFPRYHTMRGRRCLRKAGWDTHGLPVEVEVCKELGIHSKEEIEEYGVEPFIQLCQKSVWRYMQEWERLTERLGFWLKLDEAYVTCHQSYIESVWWSLKSLFDRGLLYQGHKIVWWWAQGGTALSSGEVGLGYKSVADPSVFVLFPLVDRPGTSLLVWTTTPWTLPSNQFAAVHESIEYATVHDPEAGIDLILAKDLVAAIGDKVKRKLEIRSTCKGSELVGLRYRPPFDYFYAESGERQGKLKSGGTQHVAWRITSAEFVTTDSGSGAVHEAPAFGEVDYELLVSEQARFADGEGPELICAVDPNGKFNQLAPDLAGQWVKDADKVITRRLKEIGRLYHLEQYLHEYPFCWRADNDPLIQYPRKSWFIRTTRFRDEMLANNREINWLPGHIRDGRFGNFLESNVDWALSRERYWGTPLPIWVCDSTGNKEAVDSWDALMAKAGVDGMEVWEAAKRARPELPDDLRVHKPYIDNITYDSPWAPGARMKRVPEVIDCWYDSGAMPFAQWGYPHRNKELFESQFPADFISEAIDQTRGWFYSLLAISTMMFGKDGAGTSETANPHPFRNCIVLGLMLSEWYESKTNSRDIRLTRDEADNDFGAGNSNHFVGKMSKQKRNYLAPSEIFDRYGADALRWYFFSQQPPWTSIRYSEQQIRDSIPEFLLRLWNVYSFLALYAQADGFDPSVAIDGDAGQLSPDVLARARSRRKPEVRSELDRWLISEMNRTVAEVTRRMDEYDNYSACQQINRFVDNLSNWYVRRSRDRFWSSDKEDPDKLDAYWTLYECLLATSRMIAPFVPFIAESLWQRLTSGFGSRVVESVHLCDYPVAMDASIDSVLSERMEQLLEIASLGRSARAEAKLKVRQPLSGVTVVLSDSRHQAWLEAHDQILRDELNVKAVNYTTDAGQYVSYAIQPNFRRLGPRVGKLLPQCKEILGKADGAMLLDGLKRTGKVTIQAGGQTIELDGEDIQVRLNARPGWAAAQGSGVVLVLATELTPALVREGMARDLVRIVQDRRKEMDLQYADRIVIGLVTDSEELLLACRENSAYIMSETLAVDIVFGVLDGSEGVDRDIGDIKLELYIRRVE
jgi:isoleucyl-tRNA synthetase